MVSAVHNLDFPGSLFTPLGMTRTDVLEPLVPKPFQLASKIKPRTENGNSPSTSNFTSILSPCARLITSSSNRSLGISRSTRSIPTSLAIYSNIQKHPFKLEKSMAPRFGEDWKLKGVSNSFLHIQMAGARMSKHFCGRRLCWLVLYQSRKRRRESIL